MARWVEKIHANKFVLAFYHCFSTRPTALFLLGLLTIGMTLPLALPQCSPPLPLMVLGGSAYCLQLFYFFLAMTHPLQESPAKARGNFVFELLYPLLLLLCRHLGWVDFLL